MQCMFSQKVWLISSVYSVMIMQVFRKLNFLVVIEKMKLVCVLGRQYSFCIELFRLMLVYLLWFIVISVLDSWQLLFCWLVYGFRNEVMWCMWYGLMIVSVFMLIRLMIIGIDMCGMFILFSISMLVVIVSSRVEELKFGCSSSSIISVLVMFSGLSIVGQVVLILLWKCIRQLDSQMMYSIFIVLIVWNLEMFRLIQWCVLLIVLFRFGVNIVSSSMKQFSSSIWLYCLMDFSLVWVVMIVSMIFIVRKIRWWLRQQNGLFIKVIELDVIIIMFMLVSVMIVFSSYLLQLFLMVLRCVVWWDRLFILVYF